MSDDSVQPFIGPSEQALFDIEDTRERADRLQAELTPRLAELLDDACDLVEEVYGEGSLEPYRISLTPAHRPGAKKTEKFEVASAGLVMRGQPWYFQLRIQCSRDKLWTRLFGHRGNEANPIISVLKIHEPESTRIIEHAGCFLHSRQVTDAFYDESFTTQKLIKQLTPFPERDWDGGVGLEGPGVELPVETSSTTCRYYFAAMFPLFRAATDILLRQTPIRRSHAASARFRTDTNSPPNQEDRFLTYAGQFWDWDASLVDSDPEDDPPPEPDFGKEGGFKIAMVRHRKREKKLRQRKIREAMRLGEGSLRCEVPGCGFDFLKVYGEIGRAFAHVHHLNPLSGYSAPLKTRLSDLVIVCANCHAMIHRGNQCRKMEGLIPQGS